jgi:competence protein ComEC
LLAWRQTLTWRIQRLLPGDAGALLSGILYGERNLAEDTAAIFRTAGMTHLIAVSGSNIALVVSLFVPLFLALGYRRKPAIILAGVAVTTFVLFVGAEASVVRAAIMGWLALLARVFGRKAATGRLLIIAATAIVLFDPWALAFDAGFALSFLATWGLLSWAGRVQQKLTWLPEACGLREAFSTTLAATLITTPYSLWHSARCRWRGCLQTCSLSRLSGSQCCGERSRWWRGQWRRGSCCLRKAS